MTPVPLTALSLRLLVNEQLPNALVITQSETYACPSHDYIAGPFSQAFADWVAKFKKPGEPDGFTYNLSGRKCTQFTLAGCFFAMEAYAEVADAAGMPQADTLGLFNYTLDNAGGARHCRSLVVTDQGVEFYEFQTQQFTTLSDAERKSADFAFFPS